MTLTRDRPEILTPPEHPPACCRQQTITVPPETSRQDRAKARLSPAAHRRSYARRTGAERTFSTAKDPASNNIARGWTRLMGLTPLMLWLACLLVVRNQRILTTWDARQADDARRAAGLPPRARRRRRKTLTDLAATTAPRPDRGGTDPGTAPTARPAPPPRPESRTCCPGQPHKPATPPHPAPARPTPSPAKCETQT